MTEIDFYTNPMSRGQIARWMLEEIGEPYEEHILKYGKDMHLPDYLAINPMGKVPAIRHQGRVVTEAAAICAYLAAAFPEKGLLPQEDELADYYRWMFFAAGPVEQAVTSKSMGWEPDGPKQQGTIGFGSYDLAIDTLEKAIEGKDYICGDRFTAADVYVGAQVDWGLIFKTIPSRPVFEAYAARLRARPAYIKAKARDGELMAAMQPGS